MKKLDGNKNVSRSKITGGSDLEVSSEECAPILDLSQICSGWCGFIDESKKLIRALKNRSK